MSLQEKSELANNDGTLDIITFLLREYEALREEILKRMEIENQLTGLAMIALGTLATFAVQYQNPLLLLSYPTLAMFLSFGWSHSDNETMKIGTYIKEHIEARLGSDYPGWEHFLDATRRQRLWLFRSPSLYRLSNKGIFIGKEVFALILGVFIAPHMNENINTYLLQYLAFISFFITIVILVIPLRKLFKIMADQFKQRESSIDKISPS